MNVKALAIFLGGKADADRAGVLFQYRLAKDTVTTRFVADDAFAARAQAPTLSASLLAADSAAQKTLWSDLGSTPLNGKYSSRGGWLLPAFFQNLLPEGVFRDHIAELRKCEPKDHFEMLAACGKDLPGNVYALPVELTRDELERYVTQKHDALEMTVTADPLEEGVSLSGVQPKLAVTKVEGRYVARTRLQDAHIIAKLPVVGQPRLPELEDLSLRLAAAAGARVCTAYLVPLGQLGVEHGYDLGEANNTTNFLAVERYDRDAPGRVHCEDFAQVLGVWPEDKYLGASYLEVAAAMLTFESLGESAVQELLRRIVVNEMLGNPDMHLKNMGLRYPDGTNPELPGAYDIVAYAANAARRGHALHILPPESQQKPRVKAGLGAVTGKPQMTPQVLRQFCAKLGLAEKPMAAVIRECVLRAYRDWPEMISASQLTALQKSNLLAHFGAHHMVASLARRAAAAQDRKD
jgi:serine/threonine-protein kinase HipA